MYELKPKAVFAHRRVYENPEAVERMERILKALGMERADVATVDLADVDRIIECAGAGASEAVTSEEFLGASHGRIRQGHFKKTEDSVLVFNTYVWDESRRIPVPASGLPHNLQARRLTAAFCGIGGEQAFSRRELLTPEKEFVCQGGWGIHTTSGCVHGCQYCEEGAIANLFLDIEDFCHELASLFRRRPRQMLYRYDLFSDVLAYEPEYGACMRIGRCFAEHGKYLLLYTRSDNVEWLANMPEEHKPYVPINWTLSMESQARWFEGSSPPLTERLGAMKFCQEHGYTVRAGFSPVIPIVDWRRETTDMIERLFRTVSPEVVRVWVLALIDAAECERVLDVDRMDPELVRRMREGAAEMNGSVHAPFPPDARAQIYEYYIDEMKRVSPDTPFVLCSEHPEIWNRLEHRLLMNRDRLFCCCGGLSVPGSFRSMTQAV